MRRTDREITSPPDKLSAIRQCTVCRLGLSDDGMPYIVPLNYGYTWEDERLTLYFHSANAGKKLDVIKKNNNACFEIDCDHQLIEGEKPCDYGYAYRSVVGFGKITFIESKEGKTEALNHIMKHQTGKDDACHFDDAMLARVCVYKLVVDAWTGKERRGA
jgi:nitroimidazol reductase NimA-like FMN-containing flavoprotein (pyridoxamine 5'-phosphate oxidase superfamily)